MSFSFVFHYKDDICLLFQKLQNMQTKSDHLALVVEKTGLRISTENTKVIRANSKLLKDVKPSGGRPQL